MFLFQFVKYNLRWTTKYGLLYLSQEAEAVCEI